MSALPEWLQAILDVAAAQFIGWTFAAAVIFVSMLVGYALGYSAASLEELVTRRPGADDGVHGMGESPRVEG